MLVEISERELILIIVLALTLKALFD